MSVARGREEFKFFFPDNEPGNRWDNEVFMACIRHNDLMHERQMESFRDENKSHPIEQIKFAFGMMWKMRNLLGGESRLMAWFKHAYGQNPNYPKALAEIEQDNWNREAGVYKRVDEVLAEKTQEQKKVFFDPPAEKTQAEDVDLETGEVLEPTAESLGF